MSTEPLWSASDEQTGCHAECFYESSTMIYKVSVTRDGETKSRYFPAFFEPVMEISSADLEKAMLLAVELAEAFPPKEGYKDD